MNYWKTNLDVLTTKDIESFIVQHQATCQRCSDLWEYYKGKNVKILSKRDQADGNPNNKTPVSYARKIVTTYTGYAHRPKYVTYKAVNEKDSAYLDQLKQTFQINSEHIKTHRAGRDTAVYGFAYELLYVDDVNGKAEPRFFNVSPKELILLYDFEPEPQKKIAIYYYKISDKEYKVVVYYKDTIIYYDRKKSDSYGEWTYTETSTEPNVFKDIQVVPYYFGDDCIGIIEPVLPLIDDYDQILSGSIDEFERFANSYLKMVGMTMGGSQPNNESAVRMWLQRLKRNRVFENLKDKDSVSFLTKDIPTEFVKFMSDFLHEQIHTQSSVPDFMEFSDISGDAIDRLMFDFENVASAGEADFDSGLYERIRLINKIYANLGKLVADPQSISINHKRNIPSNLKQMADTANTMKQAGFSREAIIGVMPEEIIPDPAEELRRQQAEEVAIPNVDAVQ